MTWCLLLLVPDVDCAWASGLSTGGKLTAGVPVKALKGFAGVVGASIGGVLGEISGTSVTLSAIIF